MAESIVRKANVGFYPKEKPGMGKALKGQLILTDQRLVYIRYLGGKYLTAKATDYSDKIEEGLRNEGSFEVPLNMITEAKADRVWGTPFFRLRYQTASGEKVCSLVFVSSMNMMGAGSVWGLMKTPYDQLAKAIEQLKTEHGGSQLSRGVEGAPKCCPSCGQPLGVGDRYCMKCGYRIS